MNADDENAWFDGENFYKGASPLVWTAPEHMGQGWYGSGGALTVRAQGPADAEMILDSIRRLRNVEEVKIDTPPLGGEWRVRVMTQEEGSKNALAAVGVGPTLREAALDAYGRCGQEVTYFDTVIARASGS
jgi:hypothetical protein